MRERFDINYFIWSHSDPELCSHSQKGSSTPKTNIGHHSLLLLLPLNTKGDSDAIFHWQMLIILLQSSKKSGKKPKSMLFADQHSFCVQLYSHTGLEQCE